MILILVTKSELKSLSKRSFQPYLAVLFSKDLWDTIERLVCFMADIVTRIIIILTQGQESTLTLYFILLHFIFFYYSIFFKGNIEAEICKTIKN